MEEIKRELNEKEYLEYIDEWKNENKKLIDNKIRRKIKNIFLENLPHSKSWKQILWRNCIGYKVYFIYDNIEDWIDIIDYNKDLQSLTIKYRNKKFYIKTTHFCKCKLGVLLDKKVEEFRFKIGQRIIDYNKDGNIKRDFTITNKIRKRNKSGDIYKYYQYTCNLCGFNSGNHWNCKENEYRDDFWILESGITKGSGCVCCCNPSKIMVQGINDIPTTDPWMVKYFQGGYNEAKKYTKSSNKKICPVCPDCGRVSTELKTINNIYKNHSIGCICSDKIPYGEKFMYSILEQLGSNFQTQLTKKTFEWCDKYKYDFYFETNNEKYIIETHGLQHYEENNNFEMSLSEQIENDRLKKELAIKNGIKEENYIVIDCRRSELDWIKSDIIKSNLFKLYDFKNVNWTKVVEFTSANLSKVACNYKKENIKLSCIDISKIMGFHANTIRQWIEKGIESDFFKNDSENSNIDINLIKFKLRHLKPIICIENKNVYKSVVDISADSENIFGEYFYKNSISRVARGQRKQYKNFTFKYVEDLTQDEFIKYNIKNKLQKLIELEQS